MLSYNCYRADASLTVHPTIHVGDQCELKRRVTNTVTEIAQPSLQVLVRNQLHELRNLSGVFLYELIAHRIPLGKFVVNPKEDVCAVRTRSRHFQQMKYLLISFHIDLYDLEGCVRQQQHFDFRLHEGSIL